MWQLSVDEDAAGRIGEAGGVQDVLASLRDNIDNAAIAQAACGALWSLAVKEENAKIATEEQAVQDISDAMDKHASSADLMEYACAALWSLSVEDENIDIIFDLGCVGVMIKALQLHVKVTFGVLGAWCLVASLAHWRFLSIDRPLGRRASAT